jgi:hypothetical protein
VFAFVATAIVWALGGKPNEDNYKLNIVESFIALIDSSLSYTAKPAEDINERIMEQYSSAKFGNGAKMILRTKKKASGIGNLISGEIERMPFQICCMALMPEGPDNSKWFDGKFVSMKAGKSVDGFIKIERAGIGEFVCPDEMQSTDNPDFEKNFSATGNDEATVKKYLTADVMEALLAFDKELVTPKNPNVFEFIWRGDEVLLRIGNEEMFTFAIFDPNSIKQRQMLANYMLYLKFILKLNESM